MSETKRIITDTERLDFIEATAQHYEDLFGEGRESAWSAAIYSAPMRCAKDENFRYPTFRDAVDAAILGDQQTQIAVVGVIEGPSATSAFEPTKTHDYDRTNGGKE